jgi:hypothetical protein
MSKGGVAPGGLEGSRFYALLNLKARAEEINSETPESLVSRRLPETAPDMATGTDVVLDRGTRWVNSSPAAVRGSRPLNTVSGWGTGCLLNLWRSVRAGESGSPPGRGRAICVR